MPQVESRDNFIPTDHERRVLLELIQSPQESLESIAHELKISLAALTIYLATDDAATLFAQADLANARRARTAAAAQLEQCVGALALIVRDYISDVTHNLQRETPKSRREQDRQRETTRRASTVLYRIANFTPKTLTLPTLTVPAHKPTPPNAPPLPAQRGEVPESARAVRGREAHLPPATPLNTATTPALTNPTRERGVTHALNAPPASEGQQLPARTAFTSPEHQRAGSPALPSAIRHPTSDIPHPTSPQRAGLPTPHPVPALELQIPLTISAPRTPARRSEIAHANGASPPTPSRAPP